MSKTKSELAYVPWALEHGPAWTRKHDLAWQQAYQRSMRHMLQATDYILYWMAQQDRKSTRIRAGDLEKSVND